MANETESTLTKQQLEELGNVLREKRQQLLDRQVSLDEQRIVEVAPDHVDTATDVVAEHDGQALSAHDTWLLAEVESALTRMEQGRYGISEMSGEEIPYPRLRSIPWARRTTEEEADVRGEVQSAR